METPDIKLKHKVQLRRKSGVHESVQETAKSPEQTVQRPTYSGTSRTKSTAWVWWVLAILIIFGGVIIWYAKSNNHSEETSTELMAVNESESATVAPSNEFPEGSQTQNDAPLAMEEAEMPAETPAEDQLPNKGSKLENEGISMEETASPEETPVEDQHHPAAKQVASNHESSAVISESFDVETEAMKVIRGDYGVGQERRDKLGTRYQAIQNRVNELKREGVF